MHTFFSNALKTVKPASIF